ncbi:MAG TPA: polysaccharide biosynthesis tyrosine autokinase [Actinomycetota bacterium]|nr:polysaccharide biosynthesis tyrosine autokinase [Actinomycetota bacterium]
MDQPPAGETFELREYLAVLRTRKWTVLLVTALVVAGALLLSFRQTPQYRGTSRLLVKALPEDASGEIRPPNLDTEAQLVTSEVVGERVVDELGLSVTPKDLIDGLEVAAVTEVAEVLELTFTSPDPELARDVANAFATEYIEYKKDRTAEALESGERAITAQIDSVEERLAEVTRELEETNPRADSALASTLETERSSLIARLGVLQQRADDYRARRPIDLDGGQLLEAASLPGSPSSPNHPANGTRALVLGLALGIGIAFLRERLDDRLRGRGDLEASLGLPVLATVPRFPRSGKNAKEIVLVSQPRGSASEAYRSLRTSLHFLSGQSQLKSLLVTSPNEGEGKTVTCINLAVAFAQSGRRVILISADLRRPTLEEYFALGEREGLTNWLLADEREPWEMIWDPGIDNLRVIPTGSIPPNPAELLSSNRLTHLIEVVEANSDLVLVDSPPVLAVADAAILSTHVDATLLVVDAEQTHRSAAALAAEELHRVGAGLIGSVLNGFDPGATPYGGKSYYATYESRPPAEESDGSKKQRTRLGFRAEQ